MEYKAWKKNKHFKLVLSDSQSSNSTSDNSQKSSTDSDTFKIPNLPSINNEDENVSNSIATNNNIKHLTYVVSTPLSDESIMPENDGIQSQNTSNSKKSFPKDIVSARVVSPSDYTSDETFEALSLIFPITQNCRKRRSPRKRKAETHRWLACSKDKILNEKIDLMLSSDDSSSELSREVINHNTSANKSIDQSDNEIIIGSKTNNSMCSTIYQRNNKVQISETESILENIFFS